MHLSWESLACSLQKDHSCLLLAAAAADAAEGR